MEAIASNDGKVVEQVSICTICPVAFAGEARKIAAEHMGETDVSKMLPVNVGPIGKNEITHVWCCRKDWEHAVDQQLDTLKSANKEWIAGFSSHVDRLRELQLQLPLTVMLTIIGEETEVLSLLGLEVKP